MIDRLIRFIAIATLLLFVLQAVTAVLTRMLAAWLTSLLASAHQAGSLFGSLLTALLAVCFAVGLIVRTVRFIAERNPRAARERDAAVRTVRLRVRRPAEDVPPIENSAKVVEDPDPAIGEEEAH